MFVYEINKIDGSNVVEELMSTMLYTDNQNADSIKVIVGHENIAVIDAKKLLEYDVLLTLRFCTPNSVIKFRIL